MSRKLVVKPAPSGIASRRQSRKDRESSRSDERWLQILAGAATTFRRLGYANATLEDVAANVGINRASIYYYVGSKSELLIAILHQPIFDMTKTLTEIQASSMRPSEKLRAAIAAHMKALEDNHPELFIFLAEQMHLQTIGQPDRDVVKNARRYADVFTKIIVEGQKTGEVIEIHPRVAMLGIVGMCNWTHRWYEQNGPMTLGEIGEDFTTLALNGLLVSRPRRKVKTT